MLPLFQILRMEAPKIHYFLYALLKIISCVYFFVVNKFFRIAMLFYSRKAVTRPDNGLLLIPATDAAGMIRRGEIKAIDLMRAYIDRLNEVDGLINAVVEEQFEIAKVLAFEIDVYLHSLKKDSVEYKTLERTKPLLGVPFTVPDVVSINRFRKTCGLKSRMGNRATVDAEVVKNVRAAGGIFLAMTNVPETFNWAETFNTSFGRTNNPRDLRRSAGGSCGGEGAAIAAAGSVMGIGVDCMGSLRIPCALTGIFGLRITPDIAPLDGLKVPMSNLNQSIGPMCRYAKDIGPLLRAMVGNDIADNKLHLEKPVLVNNTRIYYMLGLRTPWTEPVSSDVKNTVKQAVKFFELKYDVPAYRIDLPIIHHAKTLYDASVIDPSVSPLARILTNGKADLNPFVEMVKSVFGKSAYTFPQLMYAIENFYLPPLSEDAQCFVESKRETLRNEIISLLGDNGILVFPAWPTTAPPHYKTVFTRFNFLYTAIWSTLQLPVMVCPMGLDRNNMPIAIQLIGAPYSEALLIAAARDIEDGFGGWKAPSKHGYHLFGFDYHY